MREITSAEARRGTKVFMLTAGSAQLGRRKG